MWRRVVDRWITAFRRNVLRPCSALHMETAGSSEMLVRIHQLPGLTSQNTIIFSYGFSDQNTCCVPGSLHPPWFDYPNFWWRVEIMKLFTVQFLSPSCFVRCLRPKSAHASYGHPNTVVSYWVITEVWAVISDAVIGTDSFESQLHHEKLRSVFRHLSTFRTKICVGFRELRLFSVLVLAALNRLVLLPQF